MSLYGEYIKERKGQELLEVSYGFISYSFLSDGLFIEDIFIKDSERKIGRGFSLICHVTEIANKKELKWLYGAVDLRAKQAHDSLAFGLRLGFKPSHAIDQVIYLKKEL